MAACIVEPAAFDALNAGDRARGTAVATNYWIGKSVKPSILDGSELTYIRIPEGANPEQVLERLAELRGVAQIPVGQSLGPVRFAALRLTRFNGICRLDEPPKAGAGALFFGSQ